MLLFPGAMSARAVLLLLAAVGCTSTTYARPGSVAAEAWLSRHPSAEVEADGAAAPPTDRASIVIVARSPTDVRLVAPDGNLLAPDRVRTAVDVHHGMGALEGAALGLGAGALVGAIYGGTRALSPYEQSSDCALVCNHADAAKLSAVIFGALGLVVGAATGALIGTRDVLDLR